MMLSSQLPSQLPCKYLPLPCNCSFSCLEMPVCCCQDNCSIYISDSSGCRDHQSLLICVSRTDMACRLGPRSQAGLWNCLWPIQLALAKLATLVVLEQTSIFCMWITCNGEPWHKFWNKMVRYLPNREPTLKVLKSREMLHHYPMWQSRKRTSITPPSIDWRPQKKYSGCLFNIFWQPTVPGIQQSNK